MIADIGMQSFVRVVVLRYRGEVERFDTERVASYFEVEVSFRSPVLVPGVTHHPYLFPVLPTVADDVHRVVNLFRVAI